MSSAYKYVGDPRLDGDGPRSITLYGLTFIKGGEAITVKDKAVAGKLSNNSHFQAVKRGPGRPQNFVAQDD